MSVIEILITSVILMIVLLATASVFTNSQKNTSNNQLLLTRDGLVQTVSRVIQSWNNIKSIAGISENSDFNGCLPNSNGQTCTLSQGFLKVYDAITQGYSLSNAGALSAQGTYAAFKLDGSPCSESTKLDADLCPLRVTIQYQAFCGAGKQLPLCGSKGPEFLRITGNIQHVQGNHPNGPQLGLRQISAVYSAVTGSLISSDSYFNSEIGRWIGNTWTPITASEVGQYNETRNAEFLVWRLTGQDSPVGAEFEVTLSGGGVITGPAACTFDAAKKCVTLATPSSNCPADKIYCASAAIQYTYPQPAGSTKVSFTSSAKNDLRVDANTIVKSDWSLVTVEPTPTPSPAPTPSIPAPPQNSQEELKDPPQKPPISPSPIPQTCDSNKTPYGGGDGSAANPYLICTTKHFLNIDSIDSYRELTRGIPTLGKSYFKQVRDLEFSENEAYPIYPNYIDYNGDSHSLKNWGRDITRSDPKGRYTSTYQFRGIFGKIENASIHDLTIEGAKLYGKNGGVLNTGILIGYGDFVGLNNIRISHSSLKISINGSCIGFIGILKDSSIDGLDIASSVQVEVTGGDHISGMIGTAVRTSIQHFNMHGDLSLPLSSQCNQCGLAFGSLEDNSIASSGRIEGDFSSSEKFNGGVFQSGYAIGMLLNSKFENAYSKGNVKLNAMNQSGGLIGMMTGGSLNSITAEIKTKLPKYYEIPVISYIMSSPEQPATIKGLQWTNNENGLTRMADMITGNVSIEKTIINLSSADHPSDPWAGNPASLSPANTLGSTQAYFILKSQQLSKINSLFRSQPLIQCQGQLRKGFSCPGESFSWTSDAGMPDGVFAAPTSPNGLPTIPAAENAGWNFQNSSGVLNPSIAK